MPKKQHSGHDQVSSVTAGKNPDESKWQVFLCDLARRFLQDPVDATICAGVENLHVFDALKKACKQVTLQELESSGLFIGESLLCHFIAWHHYYDEIATLFYDFLLRRNGADTIMCNLKKVLDGYRKNRARLETVTLPMLQVHAPSKLSKSHVSDLMQKLFSRSVIDVIAGSANFAALEIIFKSASDLTVDALVWSLELREHFQSTACFHGLGDVFDMFVESVEKDFPPFKLCEHIFDVSDDFSSDIEELEDPKDIFRELVSVVEFGVDEASVSSLCERLIQIICKDCNVKYKPQFHLSGMAARSCPVDFAILRAAPLYGWECFLDHQNACNIEEITPSVMTWKSAFESGGRLPGRYWKCCDVLLPSPVSCVIDVKKQDSGSVQKAKSQILAYMMFARCNFGVVTNLQEWVFYFSFWNEDTQLYHDTCSADPGLYLWQFQATLRSPWFEDEKCNRVYKLLQIWASGSFRYWTDIARELGLEDYGGCLKCFHAHHEVQ